MHRIYGLILDVELYLEIKEMVRLGLTREEIIEAVIEPYMKDLVCGDEYIH